MQASKVVNDRGASQNLPAISGLDADMKSNTGTQRQATDHDLPSKYSLNNNLKKKALMKQRAEAVDDLPSDISSDEWGEIQRYGQYLHEEDQRKKKE
jgi:hypothetical protein